MPSRHRNLGMSLIELMVALTISAVLVAGAAQVYVDSRKAYDQNETVSRLQETARYALSVIETDARMANYWGLMQNSPPISAAPLNQLVATPIAPVASTTAANLCGRNFATDVTTPLQADNNTYQLSSSNTRAAGCDSLSGWATTPVATSDTLTVRHASVLTSPLSAGTLQLCSTQSAASLISGGLCPLAAVLPVVQQTNNVIVDAYYVDRNSLQQNGLPSLHRKALGSAGGAIVWQDQEIIPGVEDMQVEFGIDPGTVSNPNIGTATRYVQPDDAILANVNTQIVAIRIWVLVRADAPEIGFIDGRTYAYADRLVANGNTYNLNAATPGRAFKPSLDPTTGLTGLMHYRRLLVSRTIQIRNSYRN